MKHVNGRTGQMESFKKKKKKLMHISGTIRKSTMIVSIYMYVYVLYRLGFLRGLMGTCLLFLAKF